ncbi:PREDICTED: WAS/WASL-interacting protein family member 3-like, partial [Chinchilla lanigera]|uniref:WAS/WASL-interacting protein family member 3-like n=1 Tax=Chinchilla lanigera TaxID=34839 RepID=UPI0006982765
PARACACAERGARGGWAVGCSTLGSAASLRAVGAEPQAAVSTQLRADANEPGGIARSGQAHGRLSGTPPPPQPPPPPPPPFAAPRAPPVAIKKPPAPPRRSESPGQAGAEQDFMSDLMKALQRKRGQLS